MDVRASQAERDRVVDELRRHAGDGRLEVDELEQRVERALAARTRDDLARLLADLPSAPPRRRRRHGALRGHLVAISVLLIAIWAATGAGYFWPVWAIGGLSWWAFSPSCGSKRAQVGSRRDGVQALRT